MKLYQRNNLPKMFNAPINVQGYIMAVFEIENGSLKAVNTMSLESSPSQIK